MDISTTLVAAVAFIGAITGFSSLLLNIVNTRRNIVKDEVRLRIRPSCSFVMTKKLGALGHMAFLTIINLSDFPVQISSIGHRLKNGQYIQYRDDMYLKSKMLPMTLEYRQSWTFGVSEHYTSDLKRDMVKKFVVHTLCGESIEARIPRKTRKLFAEKL